MKEVTVEFSEKDMTGNAGLVHVGRFVKKLNLKKILAKSIGIVRASNAVHQVSDVVIMLIMGVFAGAEHMNHMAILRTDTVIRSIFGWKDFPADSTFGTVFKLFDHRSCHELSEAEDIARRKVWKKKWYGRITMDFDSTVRGVYGSQEGAEVGYNPKKKGQKSYHPLLCFIAETRECLHNWFRPGDTYSGNGIAEFSKECFARLPKGIWKIFARGDSAFFNGLFMDTLENRGATYLIKVKMRNLEGLLEKQEWKKTRNASGFEVAEFEYRCQDWKRPRRFVAVRKLVEVITEGVLFPEFGYDYFCYVTNADLTAWKAHKTYGQRATSENQIEWCKSQMAAGSILTQDYWANSAIFQTCILAYNLMVWMMWLTNGYRLSEEPDTIRFRLIHVPGRLLRSGHQLLLRLSKNWCCKDRWLVLENFIDQVCFP